MDRPALSSKAETTTAAATGRTFLSSGGGGTGGARKDVVATPSATSAGNANTSKVSVSAQSGSKSASAAGGLASASGPLSGVKSLKKTIRKKRKAGPGEAVAEDGPGKKIKKIKRKKDKDDDNASRGSTGANSAVAAAAAAAAAKKKARKQAKKPPVGPSLYSHLEQPGLTPAQIAVNEQMRKALEEDQYSANGSIVDTDTDDDEHQYVYKGQSVRLDRTYLAQAAKKHVWLGGGATSGKPLPPGSTVSNDDDDEVDDDDDEEIISTAESGGSKKSAKAAKNVKDKKKRGGRNQYSGRGKGDDAAPKDNITSTGISSTADDVIERDEGSIFGQTTGASNATWVECDKCHKWRRLRGVVDERKLPPKWYCSMNKNDPERARCSAPEEEYDAAHTPESAADARTRKHLRVWVRRLQCNEQYESRQPTLTRGKKRAVASSSKEPHEWIRCCNPSCGKWRVVLRIMDAKQNVIDRTTNGEWYCVMNTWDEKTASCAAPQENLPAVGCPPWVMQDEN